MLKLSSQRLTTRKFPNLRYKQRKNIQSGYHDYKTIQYVAVGEQSFAREKWRTTIANCSIDQAITMAMPSLANQVQNRAREKFPTVQYLHVSFLTLCWCVWRHPSTASTVLHWPCPSSVAGDLGCNRQHHCCCYTNYSNKEKLLVIQKISAPKNFRCEFLRQKIVFEHFCQAGHTKEFHACSITHYTYFFLMSSNLITRCTSLWDPPQPRPWPQQGTASPHNRLSPPTPQQSLTEAR